MSSRVLILPLNLADFPTPTDALNPGFLDLVTQELGDSGTDQDGFDSVLSDLVMIVDALENGLVLLSGQEGGTLDEAFAEVLALDPAPAAQNIVDFTAATTAYDGDVGVLSGVLTGVSTPTVPQCLAGAKADAAVSINFTHAEAAGTLPLSHTLDLFNTSQGNVTITGTTVSNDVAGAFDMALAGGPTVPPNGKITITATLKQQVPDGTAAWLSICTDVSSTPEVVLAGVNVQAAGGGAGGGHGGSGGPGGRKNFGA